jgi:hypothetical protein
VTTDSSTSHQSDSPGQPNSPRKHRWAIDSGLAQIIAALIAVAGSLIIAYFLGQSHATKNTTSPSAPKITHGVARATITPPTTEKIPFASTLSGRVFNLQRGELVWTFFQAVRSNGSFDSQTYPTSGPCKVDFAKNTWTCRDAYIGTIRDHRTYSVCVAVLNFTQAYTVGKLIENTYAKNLNYWFASPPSYIHHTPTACMSVVRKN